MNHEVYPMITPLSSHDYPLLITINYEMICPRALAGFGSIAAMVLGLRGLPPASATELTEAQRWGTEVAPTYRRPGPGVGMCCTSI